MGLIKSTIKDLVPLAVLSSYRRNRLRWDMKRAAKKSRKEVFSEIYAKNRWGGAFGTFNSGSGSHPDVTESYASMLRSLIRAEKAKHIVDLGCGDFQVGSQIISPELDYVGCDIVPEVVNVNAARFANERVLFRLLDIVTDPLPEGDLCVIRQVFQHLSNAHISVVLEKAKQYPIVVITDEQVVGDTTDSNVDICPYHGTRRVYGKGLKIEHPPFCARIEILLEHSSGSERGTVPTYLRTVVIRN
jgi:SAM-dependent methyltransferase